jgi:hypothetical protein
MLHWNRDFCNFKSKSSQQWVLISHSLLHTRQIIIKMSQFFFIEFWYFCHFFMNYCDHYSNSWHISLLLLFNLKKVY